MRYFVLLDAWMRGQRRDRGGLAVHGVITVYVCTVYIKVQKNSTKKYNCISGR